MKLKDFPGVTVDRSEGLVRHYYRPKGGRKVRLHGEPGTGQFLRSYLAAKNGTAQPAKRAAPARQDGPRLRGTLPGDPAPRTLLWLCDLFQGSGEWRKLDRETQRNYRGHMRNVCATPNPLNGKQFGDGIFFDLSRANVKAIRSAHSDRPSACFNYLATMARLYNWARDEAELKDGNGRDLVNPFHGIKTRRLVNTGGHPTMSEDDIAKYRECHPVGTVARLCLELYLYTGVRISDVVRLGPAVERDGRLAFTEKKHGTSKHEKFHAKTRSIKIHPELRAIIDATNPTGLKTYLVSKLGTPFTRAGLYKAFKRWCMDARLQVTGVGAISSHTVRKAGATRVARNRGTLKEIMAYGAFSAQMAIHYSAAAEAEEMNDDAIDLVARPVRNRR